MEDIIRALCGVHLEKSEAKAVAQKLAAANFTTLQRLRLIDKPTLQEIGITAAFDIKAVLSVASGTSSASTSSASSGADSERTFDLFLSHIKNRTADGALKIYELIHAEHPELRIFLDVEMGFTLDKLKDQAGSSTVFVAFVCDKYLSRGFCVVELIAAHKGGAELFAINSVFSGEIGLPYGAIIKGFKEKGDAYLLELIDEEQFSNVKKGGYTLEDFGAAVRWLLNFKGVEFHPQALLDVKTVEIAHLVKIILQLPAVSSAISIRSTKGRANEAETKLRRELDEAERLNDTGKIIRVLEEATRAKMPDLIATVLEKIAVISRDDSAKVAFRQVGACKAVVDVLSVFGTVHKDVSAKGCRAVGNLAVNDSNSTELGRMGACKAVVDALPAFGSKESKVAEYGCQAVGNLAIDDTNSTELGRLGACKAVVDALNAFGSKDSMVARWGCFAVGNLANNNDTNRTELGRLGACKAVVDVLNAFGSKESKVAQNGCYAVGNLAYGLESSHSDNKRRLKDLGASAAVARCLENTYKARAKSCF